MKYYEEERIMSLAQLRAMPVKDNGEPLVPLVPSKLLSVTQIGEDMKPITGEQIYVRQTVATKLGSVCLALAERDDNLRLQIVYGYRALSIQQGLFDEQLKRLSCQYNGDALLEAAHQYIALPSLAGHPTGGAVDVQLIDSNGPLDFGTPIWDLTERSKTFYSETVSAEARNNRMLLRDKMMTVGFTPFDGEWWHFSYGDPEWAAYSNQLEAIYKQVEFRQKASE